jgi:DNA-binding beta-propeller fold protein YncE
LGAHYTRKRIRPQGIYTVFFQSKAGVDAGSDGRVYVADSDNDRCQQFTSTGSFLQAWGSYGTGNGQFDFPYDIAVNDDGDYVYVADTENNRIQYFYDNPNPDCGSYGFAVGTNVTPTSFGKVKALFQ